MAMRTGRNRRRLLVLASAAVARHAATAIGAATPRGQVRSPCSAPARRPSSSTSSSATSADVPSAICGRTRSPSSRTASRARCASFRLVEGADRQRGDATSATNAAPPAATAQPDPLRRITLVSLVFDHLGQNARQLALKAAQDYLTQPLPAGALDGGVLARPAPAHAAGIHARHAGALSRRSTRATSAALKEDAPMLPGASRERAATPTSPRSATPSSSANDAQSRSPRTTPIQQFRETILRDAGAGRHHRRPSQRGHVDVLSR